MHLELKGAHISSYFLKATKEGKKTHLRLDGIDRKIDMIS